MTIPSLYITVSDNSTLPTRVTHLLSLLDRVKPAALRLDNTDPLLIEQSLALIQRAVQERGIALFLTDLPDLAQRHLCDGVHFSSLATAQMHAKTLLSDGMPFGVLCNGDRHDAIDVAECGAQYIAVPCANIPLIQWWTQMMEIPLVGEHVCTRAQADDMQSAGAEFIATTFEQIDDAASPLIDYQVANYAEPKDPA